MNADASRRVALLVQTGPARSRESRAEVDLALAILALDVELELYFLGDAILQLAKENDLSSAALPAGYKAWAALPELGEVKVFAESAWLTRCERRGIELCLAVEGLGFARMKRGWRACGQVLTV